MSAMAPAHRTTPTLPIYSVLAMAAVVPPSHQMSAMVLAHRTTPTLPIYSVLAVAAVVPPSHHPQKTIGVEFLSS